VVSRRRLAGVASLLALAGSLLLPAASRACAVCYGSAESSVLHGTRLSIVFLLVLTYLLLGGGIVGFLLLRRRAGQQQEAGVRHVRTSEGLP
jgi:hypothetical protein